jgi:Bacterial regulatory helix-turn-helix protein, lysR family
MRSTIEPQPLGETFIVSTGKDTNLLVALDVLLADGSVVGAARRLGLSASAMSRTLARLREATGDRSSLALRLLSELQARRMIMRMLLNIRIPHEPFNAFVRDGTIGEVMARILEETKPEAAYFTEQNGARGAILVVNLDEPSQIPAFAEPWFLMFNADCEFRVVMVPEDLKKAGLENLGAKWK